MTSAIALREEVRRLLLAEGRAMSVRVNTPGTYDEASGATSTPSSTTIEGRGRVGTYRDFVVAQSNGLILLGDRVCTFQPNNWASVPNVGNELVDGSKRYSIVGIKVRELDEVICYTFQLRNHG